MARRMSSRARRLQQSDAAGPRKKKEDKDKEGTKRCAINSCDSWSDKKLGGRSLAWESAVDVWGDGGVEDSGSRRIRVCRSCYKEWKKEQKEDRENRW